MIRSLVIRQIFRLLDMALAVAVVLVGVFVVRMFLAPLPVLEMGTEPDEAAVFDDAAVLSRLGGRDAYEGLLKSGLFGSAGRWDAQAPPPPEPEPEIAEDIEESTLNLKLRGTIALEPGDPFSAAFIENTENREGVRSYGLNQEVVENVLVDTILKREVILLNNLKDPPQRERLRMEEQMEGQQVAGAAGRVSPRSGSSSRPVAQVTPTPSRSGGTVRHTTLNRDTIIREAIENYATLATITPEVQTDDSGNVLGLTAPNIGQHPLARKLGFQDNDVLQTVNNESVGSREQLMEIFERYQNANSFRIGILRNGQPNVLVFDME